MDFSSTARIVDFNNNVSILTLMELILKFTLLLMKTQLYGGVHSPSFFIHSYDPHSFICSYGELLHTYNVLSNYRDLFIY